ncbi:hypothetical protein V5O48_005884 [Marasmius crinis-equi]|uniref:Uncharacterized protein n=1 Tax=Marasmius crinis-equi TaxID=585013 RepID=A0ABR3FL14_9AGAR
MAEPSQVFPPWLTQQVITLTDAAGEPTETQTSVLYLPLTYYGPSIPLGPDFTYGGLTSPASTDSTSATSTSESTSAPSPTSITTSSSIPTSSSITPSSSSPSSLPSSSFTSSPTTSATAQPTSQGGGLPKNQLIGIIIGAILGFVFLFVFILVSYLCYNAKQKRKNRQIEDDYDFVERSPRHSGEEADPFLQRSGSGREGSQSQMKELGAGGRGAGPSGSAGGVGTGNIGDNSLSSNGSSSSGSGYGTVLDRPTLSGPGGPGIALAGAALAMRNHRQILSKEELRRLSEEEEPLPTDSAVSLRAVPSTSNLGNEEMLPLMPPPRLHDSASQTRSPSRTSIISQGSAAEAKLMTARRVRAEDLEPRTPPTQAGDLPPTAMRNVGDEGAAPKRDSWKLPGWLGALPIIGSASSSSRDHQESERLMISDELQPPPPIPRLGVYAGERPISSVSAKSAASGSTVYHDAHDSPYSSARGTPDLQAPKGVVARSGSAAEMGYWTGARPNAPASSSNLRQANTPPPPSGTQTPPSAWTYDDHTLSSTYSSTPTTHPQPGHNVDILDMPIPRTEPSFGSLKESVGASSSNDSHDPKKWPFPPGLGLVKVDAWDETEGETPSPGSYGASIVARSEADALDLDEAPPSAGVSWRTLSRGGEADPDHGRRTTFGMAPVVHFTPGFQSEAASLYTHLSPRSGSGSGSGSGSNHLRDHTGSTGSSSSRRARSMLSGASSFSSDSHGRNRSIRGPGALSPVFGQPLSAAFQEPYTSQPSSPTRLSPPPVPSIPPTLKPGMPARAGTGIAPPAPVVTRRDREGTELELPWAAGLNENWSPT